MQDGFEGRERRGGVDGRIIKEQIKKQLLPPDSDQGAVSDSEDENADVEDVNGQCVAALNSALYQVHQPMMLL